MQSKIEYNSELERWVKYTEVFVTETTTVKDLTDLQVRHHWWRDPDGEYWADSARPLENFYADMAAYRKRKRFLTPGEIKERLKSLNLSLDELSDRTEIPSKVLNEIQRYQRLQTAAQDAKLRQILEEPNHAQPN